MRGQKTVTANTTEVLLEVLSMFSVWNCGHVNTVIVIVGLWMLLMMLQRHSSAPTLLVRLMKREQPTPPRLPQRPWGITTECAPTLHVRRTKREQPTPPPWRLPA